MHELSDAGFIALAGPSDVSNGISRWKLAERSRCFEGHFEGDPILPAVAHLALAVHASAVGSAGGRMLLGLQGVRFKSPLRPGDEVEVHLADGPRPSSVRFEIHCHGETASIGLLLFAPIG